MENRQDHTARIIPTTGRNNCGGRCIIYAHVQDGKLQKLSTESICKNGVPLTACARGMHYHKTYLNENRLLYPMKRVGPRGSGQFQRISWEEAVNTIVCEWKRIRDTYGVGSRYVNYATGVSAAFSGRSLAKRLLALDGGFLDYYNSYSTACIAKATELMYGTAESGSSLDTLEESRFIILWGHNPAETRFDAETMYYLRRARDRGVPIVVVDPRRSDTVETLGARWIPIHPGTDAAMMDAMAYVIYKKGLHNGDFLDRYCLGFDEGHMPEGIPGTESYLSYLLGKEDGVPKTPQWAETITGVPAGVTEQLAVQYATVTPAALIQGYGAQRHAYGEQSVRGGITLACMTGNVGIEGAWASGVAYYHRHKEPHLPYVENPYGMSIPSFLWTEAVERGDEMTTLDGVAGGQKLSSNIKMIINLAGNCLVNQHGDINRTMDILRDETKCEFILCSDLFMTASAKFADILLPGVSFLEDENITAPWMYGDFLGYNPKIIEPMGEGRTEYLWLSEVAEGLGLKEAFTEGRCVTEWLRFMYESLRKEETELPEYEDFCKKGIYRYRDNPKLIAFQRQCSGTAKFPTESGKIEIFSPEIYRTEYRAFMPAIPRYVSPREGFERKHAEELQMVGYHTKRRCHSIHDNTSELQNLDPQRLWMHPADAAARGISEGDRVLVWNDRGRMLVLVKITENVMEGVTALAQGAWYRPDEEGIDLGGSINVLTSLDPTPYARGNTQHTILVHVEKVR